MLCPECLPGVAACSSLPTGFLPTSTQSSGCSQPIPGQGAPRLGWRKARESKDRRKAASWSQQHVWMLQEELVLDYLLTSKLPAWVMAEEAWFHEDFWFCLCCWAMPYYWDDCPVDARVSGAGKVQPISASDSRGAGGNPAWFLVVAVLGADALSQKWSGALLDPSLRALAAVLVLLPSRPTKARLKILALRTK